MSPRPAVVTAVPTPFTAAGRVDHTAFCNLLADIDPHVDAVLIAGTTGEFPALSDRERVSLFADAAEVLDPDRVIAHIGHHSVHQVLGLLEATSTATAISRFAAMSPMFFEVDDASTVGFYRILGSQLGSASLYGYLFPERTGNQVSADAMTEILSLEGIAGLKLSGGANALLAEAIEQSAGKEIYTGNDAILRRIHDLGGAGIVSGCSAAFPDTFSRLAHLLTTGDERAIADAEAETSRVVGLVGPSIHALKRVLAEKTGAAWSARMTMRNGRPDL